MAGQRKEPDHFYPNDQSGYRIFRASKSRPRPEDHAENFPGPDDSMFGSKDRVRSKGTKRELQCACRSGETCPSVTCMKSIKKIINVGVVGCGYWGPNLIRNLRQ